MGYIISEEGSGSDLDLTEFIEKKDNEKPSDLSKDFEEGESRSGSSEEEMTLRFDNIELQLEVEEE